MALPKRKKEIQPWRQGILAHHGRKEKEKPKRQQRDPEEMTKAQVRLEVASRDRGNWCLLCGKPGPGLHLHRVIYGGMGGGGGRYEVDNCVLLCFDHHTLVHSSKETWQPLLLDHIKCMKFDPELSPIFKVRPIKP